MRERRLSVPDLIAGLAVIALGVLELLDQVPDRAGAFRVAAPVPSSVAGLSAPGARGGEEADRSRRQRPGS